MNSASSIRCMCYCLLAFAIVRLHLLNILLADAIVINSPALTPQKTAPPRTFKPTSPITKPAAYPHEYRIRKTKASDIDAVSSMLAAASTTEESNNWKHRIKCLAVKSSLEKQLHNRLHAIEEGRKTVLRFKQQYSTYHEDDEECTLDEETTCHVLWSNDVFRHKLQSAVSVSSERNAWDGYNFDYTPQDVGFFNHAMMTVVQNDDMMEEVVGFCEVAWLPRPSIDNTSDNGLCIPSIVNLITSPSHRRRGLASKLMDVALRYARTQWLNTNNCLRRREIGLYVHPENKSALYLYRRKGFRVEMEEDGLLYMSTNV